MAQDLFTAVADHTREKSADTAPRSIAEQCRRPGQMGVVHANLPSAIIYRLAESDVWTPRRFRYEIKVLLGKLAFDRYSQAVRG
jgi:hypothetical protein